MLLDPVKGYLRLSSALVVVASLFCLQLRTESVIQTVIGEETGPFVITPLDFASRVKLVVPLSLARHPVVLIGVFIDNLVELLHCNFSFHFGAFSLHHHLIRSTFWRDILPQCCLLAILHHVLQLSNVWVNLSLMTLFRHAIHVGTHHLKQLGNETARGRHWRRQSRWQPPLRTTLNVHSRPRLITPISSVLIRFSLDPYLVNWTIESCLTIMIIGHWIIIIKPVVLIHFLWWEVEIIRDQSFVMVTRFHTFQGTVWRVHQYRCWRGHGHKSSHSHYSCWARLLLHQYFTHLLHGDCWFHIDPLACYLVLRSHLQHLVHREYASERHEAETAWPVSSFILKDDYIIKSAKLLKILLKLF